MRSTSLAPSRFIVSGLRQLRGFFLLAQALGALVIPAFAHDPGLSTAVMHLKPDGLEATLTLSLRDAACLAAGQSTCPSDGVLVGASATITPGELHRLASTALELRLDARPTVLEVSDVQVEQANAVVSLRVRAGVWSNLWVHSKWLALLPPGHRQFLSVQGRDGRPLTERLLSANSDTADVRVEAMPSPGARATTNNKSFGEFLLLGIRHILIGYDHLLFLFSLLMVVRGWGATFKLITAFTVAHSLTLALATFGAIDLPTRVVEPLIAASIVYVGVENFVRRQALSTSSGQAPKGRTALTFAFGLVHGLGFASVLRELGVAATPTGVLVPLLSFNLGVELGQLLIATILVPLLWLVIQQPLWTKRLLPVCSGLVTLAGSYWLVQRLWG